jgi:hypothetical protein
MLMHLSRLCHPLRRTGRLGRPVGRVEPARGGRAAGSGNAPVARNYRDGGRQDGRADGDSEVWKDGFVAWSLPTFSHLFSSDWF